MNNGLTRKLIISIFLLYRMLSVAALAQTPPIRGVDTPGFSATNSGVLPGPGSDLLQHLSGIFV